MMAGMLFGRALLLFVFVLFATLHVQQAEARVDRCSSGAKNSLQNVHKLSALFAANTTCTMCEVAVTATRAFITASNSTEKDIVKIIEFFCTVLKIEDKNVCNQIVPEFQGLFFYLLSDRDLTSTFVCGVIDLCPKTMFPSWNASLTPTPPAVPYPKPNDAHPIIYVLHVSDIHIDPEYTPGLSFNCGEPICCRPPNPPANPGAGKWGHYNCDLSPALYQNMLEFISQQVPRISYAVFTGDMPPHDVWAETRNSSLAADTMLLSYFKQYLPHVPLFPAVGNHEGVPVNEFAPRSVGGSWNMSWLYSGLVQRWAQFTELPTDALAEAKFAGYFTTKTPDGARIVSLNTNLGCNSGNMFLAFPTKESADPDQQLHWLIQTLDAAEKANEMVYIIMHIEPSLSSCGKDWWANYLRIVDRYKNHVMAVFAGHDHDDIYSVAYAMNGTKEIRPVYVTYIPGSVAPYSDENPGFRVYHIDTVTKAVIDYDEYAINLTAANLVGSPKWTKIYSARSAYSLPDMSPASWHQASLAMGRQPALLNEYVRRRGKYSDAGSCDAACVQGTWCDTWNPPPDAPFNICGL